MSERRQPSSKPKVVRRFADLQGALARDEIEVVYQPQVDFACNRMTGVEALARWQHATLGELGPDKLFEIAARSHAVTELSHHIRDQALATAAAWSGRLGELRLSINITSEDLAEPRFAAELLGQLSRTGFPPGRLTLEITEAGLVADLARAAAMLEGLRAQGIRIAIDDFGTGYSSLAYLKALPLDCLKIDRGFSQDIVGSDRARIIVRSVIRMARELGLAVIAEGVESEEQRRLLAAEGCTAYQGFVFAPPLDPGALATLAAG